MTTQTYVHYDPETFEFLGFYNLKRKDVPEPKALYKSDTFIDDIGQHTHFDPEKMEFYTPVDVQESQNVEQQRRWRDRELRDTDVYMLPDFPISPKDREAVTAYRQQLRDFTLSWKKPKKPNFLKKE